MRDGDAADGVEVAPGGPSVAWLRARLADVLTDGSPNGAAGGGGTTPCGTAGAGLRPASVLVPVVMADPPLILLTKRSSALRHHAGQVSFPGGRIDPQDGSPERAALREAQEEIGLDPAACELVGRLPEHRTSSDFMVTPVVAFVRPDAAWRASPAEVDEILFLPVANLLDPDAVTRERLYRQGAWHKFWVWRHPEHLIWGATAGILMSLAERLRPAFGR